MRPGLVLVSAFALSGCLYVHDSDLQKTAEDAQTEFQSVADDGTTQKILDSKAEFDKATQDVLDVVQQKHFSVQLQSVPDMTWQQVADQSNAELDAAKKGKDSSAEALKAALASLKDKMGELDAAAAKTASAVDAVNAAAMTEARYAATQIVLREGLKALDKENPSLDDYDALLKEKVQTRSFEEKDGALVENSKDSTVGEVLDLPKLAVGAKPGIDDLPKLFGMRKDLPKLSAALKQLDFHSPGIAATLMSLSYDIARAEELRIQAEINREKSRIDLLKKKSDLRTAEVRALSGDPFVTVLPEVLAVYGAKPQDKIGDTLEAYSLSGADHVLKRKRLTQSLNDLSANFYYRIVVPDQVMRIDDQLAIEETDHALALADVNLTERQALISRGLEGLVAFHRGGISADDVANIMRLAQAVGIFAIAGGWL